MQPKIIFLMSALLISSVSASESFSFQAAPILIEDLSFDEDELRELNLKDSPQSTTLYNFESLQKQSASRLSDVIQEAPNVEFVGGGSSVFRRMRIRGLEGERIRTTVDGVRRVERSQGNMAADLGIETESFKMMEVHRGADSARYGSGAIGGALRAETLSAQDFIRQTGRSQGGRVRGSYESATGEQMLSGTVYGPWINREQNLLMFTNRSARKLVSGRDDDGAKQEQSERSERRHLLVRTDLDLTPRDQLSFKGEFYRSKVDDTSFFESSTDSEDDSTRYRVARDEINLAYRREINPLFKPEFRTYLSQQTSGREVIKPFRNIPSTLGSTEDQLMVSGAELSQQTEFSLTSSSAHLLKSSQLLSYEYQRLKETSLPQESFFGDSDGRELALALVNELSLQDGLVSIYIDGRLDHYERKNRNLDSALPSVEGRYFSRSLGLAFRPLEQVTLLGKIGESFRAPGLRELYLGGGGPFACHFPRKICQDSSNPNLQREMATTRELGVHLTLLDQREYGLELKSHYFKDSIRDYIQRTPVMYRVVDGQQVIAGPQNATHRDYLYTNQSLIVRQGIELEAQARYQGLRVDAKFSRMRADCVDCLDMFSATNITEPLPTAPAQSFRLRVGHQWESVPLEISVGGLFTQTQDRLSERYKQAGFVTEGYQVYDAQVAFRPKVSDFGEFEIGLAMNNLFDSRYKIHGSGTARDEFGRSWKLSLGSTF
jgi:hemoglobin/transferrin/lactoferrin receptor protein